MSVARRAARSAARRGWASWLPGVGCGAALLWSLLACGGDSWVFLDDELVLSELGDGDLEVVCEADETGYARCSGGYTAGFVSREACVETLRDQRDEGGFICDRQTVGSLRACFQVPACQRDISAECETLLGCVLRRNAERDGSSLSYY